MRTLAVLFGVLMATGAAAEPARASDPDALAKAVAPFIDEQTLAVVHADLTRIDPNAAFGRLAKLLGPLGPREAAELPGVRGVVCQLAADLLKAGARDAFLVVSLADVPAEPLLIVIPLAPGANERALRGLLYSGRADGPTERPDNPPGRGHARTQVRVVRNAVVRCEWPILQRVLKMKPPARPERAKAFAAAGDTPVHALLLPTADNRRVIEEMMPELPKEIGGGPSTALTRGLLWAAVGVNAPPKPSLRLVIQSADADSAKAMAGVLGGVYRMLATLDEARRVVPQIDKLLAALTPRVARDRLVLDLPPEKLDALLDGPVASAVRAERDRQRAHASSTHLRVIGAAVNTYKGRHDGTYPPDLAALIREGILGKRLLEGPRTGKRGYVYIRPPAGLGAEEAGRTPMVYEDPATHGRKQTHVLFADRHVERMTVDERFGDLVEQAKAASAKAYAPQREKIRD